MVNAIDAARHKVLFTLTLQSEKIIWQIEHDGPPIDASTMGALGVQWVSSKEHGLGIGYFLANASIENLQGKVTVSNQPQGVITRVELPDSQVVVGI